MTVWPLPTLVHIHIALMFPTKFCDQIMPLGGFVLRSLINVQTWPGLFFSGIIIIISFSFILIYFFPFFRHSQCSLFVSRSHPTWFAFSSSQYTGYSLLQVPTYGSSMSGIQVRVCSLLFFFYHPYFYYPFMVGASCDISSFLACWHWSLSSV